MVRRIGDLAGRHRLELVTGLAASLPVIVSGARAVAHGWMPVGDNAVIAARSYDVLTSHTPLLGQYSQASGVSGATTFSPGPMEYWLLALPARLFDPAALAVTVTVVNVAAVIGVVILARRRDGLPLMFATGLALALLCSALGAETLHSIWNPLAALLPFTLLIFVCWSLACGEFRLLPLAVLLASFAVQCHLAYALPALGLLAVAIAGLAASRREIRWSSARRWVLAAVLVGVVCWSAPLVEQAIHRPGNLVLIVRGAGSDQARGGAELGWHALVRAVGAPPWWLRDPQSPTERFLELAARPPALAVISSVAVLVGLAVVGLLGARRGRRDVVAAAGAALVLCVAVAAVTASTPRGLLIAPLGYIIQWGAPVGMFAWLVLGWGAAVLARPAWRPGAVAVRRASFAGVAAVAAVALGVAAATGADRQERIYDPVRSLTDRLDARLPDASSVLVGVSGPARGSPHEFAMQGASVYALRQNGFAVSAPSMKRMLGSWYADARRLDRVLRLNSGDPPARNGEPVARIGPPTTPSAAERKLGARPNPPVTFLLLPAP